MRADRFKGQSREVEGWREGKSGGRGQSQHPCPSNAGDCHGHVKAELQNSSNPACGSLGRGGGVGAGFSEGWERPTQTHHEGWSFLQRKSGL